MTNIYWTNCSEQNDLLDGAFSFEPILKTKEIKDIPSENYKKCYANINFFNNTYVIRSDYEFDIVIDKAKGSITHNLGVYNPIDINEANQRVVQLTFQKLFFSEKDLEISIMPPFLHHSDLTEKVTVLPGKFNISKWFRAVNSAFLFPDKSQRIRIKKGDVLYYIKFHTNDRIEFKNFSYDSEIKMFADTCGSVKERSPLLQLNKLYDMFTKNRFNKKVLKAVKEKVVE